MGDEEVAQISTVKVIKNDFGSRKKTEIRILLGEGIILSNNDIEYALERGILKQEGKRKVSYLNGKLSWSTPREFFQLYHDRNRYLDVLAAQIRKSMQQDLLEITAKYNGESSEVEEDDEEVEE